MLLLDFIRGIAAGIVIAIPVGPVGMLCVERTAVEGKLRGLVSGLGAAVADALFGSLAAFGTTFVNDELLHWRNELGLAGGLLILFLGAKALLSVHAPLTDKRRRDHFAEAFISSFGLAAINPGILFAFAGVFAALGASSVNHPVAGAALVSGVFLGSLLWWIGIAFSAKQVRQIGIKRLNQLFGLILALSGVALIAVTIRQWVITI